MQTRRAGSGLGSQHPADGTLAVAAIAAVGERLAAGLDESPQPGPDVLKLRSHQGPVAIVEHAATRGRGGAFGPARGECSGWITPAQQALQPLGVEGIISGAAHGAALVVHAGNSCDTALTLVDGGPEGYRVTGYQQAMLVLEQFHELGQARGFLGDQLAHLLATLCLIHTSTLFYKPICASAWSDCNSPLAIFSAEIL